VGNIAIENFYSFILQPPGFRQESSICEISSYKGSLIAMTSLNPLPLYELDIRDDMVVFLEWKDFYGRKMLRNWRRIKLKTGQQVNVSFTSSSETQSRLLTRRSYFIGIMIALSISVMSQGIMEIIFASSRRLGLWMTIVSIVVACVSGFLGWRVIRTWPTKKMFRKKHSVLGSDFS